MYYIRFNQENKQIAFCQNAKDKIEGYVYYNAPAEFNPKIHEAYLEEGQVKFTLIQNKPVPPTEEVAINQIKRVYSNHEINGKDYFNNMRAELVLSYKQAVRTIDDIIEIENKLGSVKALLISGDWMSALVAANTIVPSGALTVEYLDKIKLDINNYINENYS